MEFYPGVHISDFWFSANFLFVNTSPYEVIMTKDVFSIEQIMIKLEIIEMILTLPA